MSFSVSVSLSLYLPDEFVQLVDSWSNKRERKRQKKKPVPVLSVLSVLSNNLVDLYNLSVLKDL